MFSKNSDPIDNYLQLQKEAQAIGEADKHQHDKAHKKEHAGVHWKQVGRIGKKQPKFFTKDLVCDCPKTDVNKSNFDQRRFTLKALAKIDLENKNRSPGQDRVDKMPLELRAILNVDPEDGNKIYKLMGLSNKQFL